MVQSEKDIVRLTLAGSERKSRDIEAYLRWKPGSVSTTLSIHMLFTYPEELAIAFGDAYVHTMEDMLRK